MAKNYKELQDDAELLGIKQNQSTEKLIAAIDAATSPAAVAKLMSNLFEMDEINTELAKARSRPTDVEDILEDILEKIDELHVAQLDDKNVHTEPYLTGMANQTLVIRAIITGEALDNGKLIKPVTQVDVGGAKIPTQRERLIKAAVLYITMASGTPQLRSGLTAAQIEKADEIMVALGGKAGVYTLPKE